MLTLTNIPLTVYNRALEIYGEPPEDNVEHAQTALLRAEGRKDIAPDFPGIAPFAQALAEHLSGGAAYRLIATAEIQ